MSKSEAPKKYHNLSRAENLEEEEKEPIESLDDSRETVEGAGDALSPTKRRREQHRKSGPRRSP